MFHWFVFLKRKSKQTLWAVLFSSHKRTTEKKNYSEENEELQGCLWKSYNQIESFLSLCLSPGFVQRSRQRRRTRCNKGWASSSSPKSSSSSTSSCPAPAAPSRRDLRATARRERRWGVQLWTRSFTVRGFPPSPPTSQSENKNHRSQKTWGSLS